LDYSGAPNKHFGASEQEKAPIPAKTFEKMEGKENTLL